jgi:hypothetical protein
MANHTEFQMSGKTWEEIALELANEVGKGLECHLNS